MRFATSKGFGVFLFRPAELNTIVIPLSTVFTRISAAALINSPQMRRLFEGGACSSNYCNWQLKSLLHLGQIVITLRTLLQLGSFITFRPSTAVSLTKFKCLLKQVL